MLSWIDCKTNGLIQIPSFEMIFEHLESELLIPIRTEGLQVPLFLVHGVKCQAFICPHFLKSLGADQPVYAFQAIGLNRPARRHCSVQEMAGQYVSAMLEIQREGPYLIGAIAIGSVVAVEMAHQLNDAGKEVAPLLLIDPPAFPPSERSWYRRMKHGIIDRVKRKFSTEKFNEKMKAGLKRVKSEGRINIDLNDPEAIEAACHIAYDFRLALNDYQMRPYSGAVYLLGSRHRLSKRGGLRAKLIGDLKTYEVGRNHEDVHQASNQLFAQQLKITMCLIQSDLSI